MDTVRAARTKTTLFGRTYDAPFGLSPMGGISMAAYQGDLVFARAAAEANIPMILSGSVAHPARAVKEAGPTAWFQAYLPGETEPITQLVDRVARAGYETLCLTVDVPVRGQPREQRAQRFPYAAAAELAACLGRQPPSALAVRHVCTHAASSRHATLREHGTTGSPLLSSNAERERGRRDQLSWKHVELMRRMWQGRLVMKGILNKQDARIARESGVDGIIVSNHGGRQLDFAVAPLRVLPGIVSQAGGMTVMMDSGVRRGTDVLKALALGAQFVFVGRPVPLRRRHRRRRRHASRYQAAEGRNRPRHGATRLRR